VSRSKKLMRDLVEPVQVVDVVIGVRIGDLDEVHEHPPHQTERFTDEGYLLRDLVELHRPGAQLIDLVLEGFTLCHD
jgi:hypothetical protein